MTTTEKAKLIRAAIKTAHTAGHLGNLPTGTKFSVTTDYYAGGSSVTIEVKGVSSQWALQESPYAGDARRCDTPAAKHLGQKLSDILHEHLTHASGDVTLNDYSIGGHSSTSWYTD